jgi:hypothetical protein
MWPMSDASVLALVALTAFAMACRGGPAVRHERGAGHERTGEPPDEWPPADEPGRAEVPRDNQPPGEVVSVTPIEGEEDEEAELDLAVRVRNAYGYPAECLGPDAVAEGITELSIRLTVTMTATGTVTRASVYAPVSGEALACLQRRAERVRVAGPIPEAPQTVSTSIQMRAVNRLAAAQSTAQTREPPEYGPPPGNTEAPATVLPAVVGDGPAPGSVPADETLPAVVGDGPAAGSVEADITLPARAGQPTEGQGWTWIGGSAEARGEVPED